jgi:ADP-ribose pyrophosphatase
MDATAVRVIGHEAVYQGYFRVDRYQLRYPLFEGGMSPTVSREVFERGQVAAVLPVDRDRREVVLIEQFRAGAFAAGQHPWMLECVAGIIEQGETPEAVCIRETGEETGCTITELRPLLAPFLSSPGACTETVALYWARVDASSARGIHGLAEEGENIRVRRFGFDAALALLAEGRILNAKTIIALQWLALNRDRLDVD